MSLKKGRKDYRYESSRCGAASWSSCEAKSEAGIFDAGIFAILFLRVVWWSLGSSSDSAEKPSFLVSSYLDSKSFAIIADLVLVSFFYIHQFLSTIMGCGPSAEPILGSG